VLQEEGARLQKLYPGSNVQQIQLQQRALEEAWQQLKDAAAERRQRLQHHAELQTFLKQVISVNYSYHSLNQESKLDVKNFLTC
jgi:flagellar motility protein MotE (MotC chaperone)